jgi:hypothetical protein
MLMKALYTGLMVAGLVVITGCNQSTTGGTAGGGTFKLKGPANTPATEVKHTEQKTVEVTVDPDKGFKEDITLSAKVEPADKGVTAEVSPTTLKGGDYKKAEVTIKASDKANAGDYNVIVTGKPAKGQETNVTIKVKVPEKK